jgi:hypothetical protein
MIDRRPKFHLAPSDPRAVRLRFQKIAARAEVRAQQQLAAIKPRQSSPSPGSTWRLASASLRRAS